MAASEHPVATRAEWQEAQTRLLEREYEIRRLEEELAKERRQLPWVVIDKPYVFDTAAGEKTLAELFEDRSQLLMYHMMFGPRWAAGCPACSMVLDHLDGPIPHVNAHDTTVVVSSHAPLEKLLDYRRRMGWKVEIVSSYRTEFNYDFDVSFTGDQQHADISPEDLESLASNPMLASMAAACQTDVMGYLSEAPGLSSFVKEKGVVYLASACREPYGPRFLVGYQEMLNRTAKGYDENVMLRRHDEY